MGPPQLLSEGPRVEGAGLGNSAVWHHPAEDIRGVGVTAGRAPESASLGFTSVGSCMLLGKSLFLSEPRFLHLVNGDKNILLRVLWPG